MRGRFGFIGILLIGAFALLVGGVAYNWGLAAGTAQVAAPGTLVQPIYVHRFGFGFGFGGFLFLLVIVGLLIAAFRARRWAGGPGPRGMGPWGPRFDPDDPRVRHWTSGDVPPQLQPMLEAWHRRAHGPASDPGAGTATESRSGAAGGGEPATGPAATSGSR